MSHSIILYKLSYRYLKATLSNTLLKAAYVSDFFRRLKESLCYIHFTQLGIYQNIKVLYTGEMRNECGKKLRN